MPCHYCLLYLFLQARKEKELGNEAYKKKEFERALVHYNKAVELDPTDITYLNNIAGNGLNIGPFYDFNL